MAVSCESDAERYIRAQNVINKMTTLDTIIKFQFSSSQFNISKLNVQNTITGSNNIQLLVNTNVIYKFF